MTAPPLLSAKSSQKLLISTNNTRRYLHETFVKLLSAEITTSWPKWSTGSEAEWFLDDKDCWVILILHALSPPALFLPTWARLQGEYLAVLRDQKPQPRLQCSKTLKALSCSPARLLSWHNHPPSSLIPSSRALVFCHSFHPSPVPYGR